MVTVAKLAGKIVEVVRYSRTVAFAVTNDAHPGWLLVCMDFDKSNRRREQFKWVPADTKFDWVREYNF